MSASTLTPTLTQPGSELRLLHRHGGHPDRHPGLPTWPASQHGQLRGNSTYGVGVFTNDETDSKKGLAVRYTTVPIKSNQKLLHPGFSFKDIGDDKAVGLEVAATSGPLHIQAEHLNGEDADSDSLKGFYVQMGYILTGEMRPYKNGRFKRV